QPLPPRWAFGNLMSRFGYTSEAQVKSVYEKMKSENIPVDAVIFDLFWFGDSIKGTLGNLEWVNKTKWPDPRRMIGEFRKEGVHTILVTEPFFVETSLQYRASRPYLAVDSAGAPFYLTDFYFGKGGLIDIFRKDAQEWFWQFHRRQMQNGVEGWWGDLGEPEKHPAGMYHNLRDLGHRRLFAADEVHNLYGHTWTKMLYNRFAAEYPDKRLFSLNRSGFAGSQRYGIIPWTGDVSRSWSGLRAQLPVLLGMTMSGIPYVHSDAGGFAGGEGDGELYVRWLQFAAFTPVFRPHGTALYEVEPAAASFPSEPALMEEPWRSHARQAVQLRYLFLPYNYSLAYQQTSNGTPLMAPLYYYYFNDTAAMQVQDQYMWGRDMMVAPILDKGATERKVYLPAGRWLNIFSSTIHQGGQWITVPAQLTHIPVFAREGSFVPTVSRIRNISEYTSNGQFLLSYFPSRSRTTFTWFEDDGVSRKSLPSKNYTLIRCTGQDMGNRIVTEIRPDNQKFVPVSLVVSILIQKKPASVMLNGRRIPVYTSTAEIPSGTRDFAHWMPQLSSVQVHADMVKNKILQIQVIK
ncbi:MAG TPA: TIM-barrel domain-containing protein, partial [Flavisolibacter sp.]